MKQTSAELKRRARETLCGHWGILIGTLVLIILITYGAIMPFYLIFLLGQTVAALWVYLIGVVMIMLVSAILNAGMAGMYIKIAREQEITLGAMFSEFVHRPYRYVAASLLFGLLGTVCVFPGYIILMWGTFRRQYLIVLLGGLLLAGGVVLCVVLALRYTLVTYLFLDNPQLGVIAAFKESARLMKGNKGRRFYLELSFIGWSFLSMLSCGIGMLWVMPYMTQTYVQFYLDVIENSEREEHVSKEQENIAQNM